MGNIQLILNFLMVESMTLWRVEEECVIFDKALFQFFIVP